MKKLAKAQQDIDKDRILNRQAVLQRIALAKAVKEKSQSDKKEQLSELQRYRQLLSRKSVMDKTYQLRKLKGDEDGLKKYLQTQKGLLTKLQQRGFGSEPSQKKTDNLAKQLAIQGRINQAEFMLGSAISSNTRKREQQARAAERQARAARLERDNRIIATGAASGGALYMAKGGASTALTSATDLEQMGISSRAFFGDTAGQKILEDMMKYAKETAFSPQNAYSLAMGLKAASYSKTIKFSESEDEMAKQVSEMTRAIGKPILAYGTGAEGRNEISRQFFQIMSRGYTNIRQDLDVMKAHGLFALQPEIEKILGKSVNEASASGEKISAGIMLQAMINLSKSKDVDKAMVERAKSLTQSYDSLNEQTKFTAGSFGLLFARGTKLPDMFNNVSNYLLDLQNSLEGSNKTMSMSGKESLTMGQRLTVMAITVGGLTLGVLALAGAWKLMLGYLGGGILLSAFGAASAIYLLFADWKGLIEDIGKEGLWAGLSKHLDIVLATVGSIAAILGLLASGNLIGAGVLAAGLGAIAIYKSITSNNEIERKKIEDFSKTYNEGKSAFPQQSLWNQSSDYKSNLATQKMFPSNDNFTAIPTQPQVNIGLQNIINPTTGETKTKVNKNPPTIYNSWDKIYNF